MKTRNIIIAALAAIAVFAACESTFEEDTRPPAYLESLTVQPVQFNEVTGLPENKVKDGKPVEALSIDPDKIPVPIKEEEWDYINFNLAEADLEELWFLLEEDVETARIIVTATSGTVVEWGVGTTATRPQQDFSLPGAPLTFGNDDVIYVKVSTRDKKFSNYYRIHARLASPVTLLSLITVAGRDTQTPYDAGRDTWAEAVEKGTELDISITLKEGENGSDILVEKNDERSSVSYALVTGDYTTLTESQLVFKYSEKDKIVTIWDPAEEVNVDHGATNIKFEDQNWLIAKVTAQNQSTVNFYKFRVSVGRIATIASLELEGGGGLDGPVVETPVLALGVPDTAWGTVVSGSFATANRDPSFKVSVTPDDPDATYEFVRIANATAPNPDTYDSPASITFGNKEQLAIKIKSANSDPDAPDEPAVVMYYKVQVDLQSAIITVQPKSAVYNVKSFNYPKTDVPIEINGETVHQQRVLIDAVGTITLEEATIEPLEAKLDREGTFKYQWYTANSWYGGYGFDQKGRIVGDPGCLVGSTLTQNAFASFYHPTTERKGLDEKNNVSFHNGGNQFYRLPVGSYPDTDTGANSTAARPNYKALHDSLAIEGAIEATYTPKIDASKRPFIAGYSNQTQYYWVVIEDASGRRVTSERATIVTEWGEEWDMGAPTGKKVEKKHHIVDLFAYMTPGAVGLRDKPINTAPFTFHREKRAIPITFPSDFRVMDYRVATIQARFFLADGTAWIQNWTQGDVGFERNGVGLVLWYNLTNNNAAVGLAGDSKEPQGANLTETPTHIVVKPAGEKPPPLPA